MYVFNIQQNFHINENASHKTDNHVNMFRK